MNLGEQWGGYYLMDGADGKVLFGVEYMNAFPVGQYDGGTVSFVLFYKDINAAPNEDNGKNCNTFDLAIDPTESGLLTDPLLGGMFAGILPTQEQVEHCEWMHPIVKQLVLMDIAEGLSGEQIIDRRLGVMNPRFIGFTFNQIPEKYLTYTIDQETGNQSCALSRCSLEEQT